MLHGDSGNVHLLRTATDDGMVMLAYIREVIGKVVIGVLITYGLRGIKGHQGGDSLLEPLEVVL